MNHAQDKQSKTASKEQLSSIYDDMGESISFWYPALQKSIVLYNFLSTSDIEFDNKALLKDVVRINYQVLYTHLDIATIFRAELKADTPWGKRAHLKYIYHVLFEAVKALFGFDEKKQSLWVKFCNKSQGLLEKSEIDRVDKSIECFKTQYFSETEIRNYGETNIREFRNYVAHYDYNPIELYDFWISISEPKEVGIICNYLSISSDVCHLIDIVLNKITPGIVKDSKVNPVYLDSSIWERINYIPDTDGKLLKAIKTSVATCVASLDGMMKDYRIPLKFEAEWGKDAITPLMHRLLESIHPLLFLHFIYIDIGCSIMAYLTSEHYLEKQLNLRHLNVIVYEGFNKIYGCENVKRKESKNEEDQQLPYWQGLLYPTIMERGNDEWKEIARRIEGQLQQIAMDPLINNNTLRHMSVHILDKRNKDFVPCFYDKLIGMNPIIEMSKALKLFGAMNSIMWLNKEIINIHCSKIKDVQDKELDRIKRSFEEICLSIIQKSINE